MVEAGSDSGPGLKQLNANVDLEAGLAANRAKGAAKGVRKNKLAGKGLAGPATR